MERSLMLIVAVWLASSPSNAAPTALETPAEVVETPPRVMTISQLATFNHGKPFLAERDPVTGAFDLRTTPVNADDYIYEEFDESGESIDRKDDGGSHTSNHIISIPTKDSELHKFLNLPVHYSSASKFPLISSSYANTKIQGHSASNHRPATSTPSTVQPSYYPHKTAATTTITTTTTTTTTTKPTFAPSTITTTGRTTKTTPSSTTTSSPPPPSYEYEYEYDYGDPSKPSSEPPKNEYSFMDFFNFGSPSSSTTLRPATRATTVTPREPVTTRVTAPPTTRTTEEPKQTRPAQVSSTRLPSTTSQQSKVDSEPKPSTTSSESKTSLPPSQQESTMIPIKSENIPSKNKTDGSSGPELKGDNKSTEVIGLKPPVKTPDSMMKPPPRFGDRIEPANPENNQSGWKGQSGLSVDLYASKTTSSTTPPSHPPHSNGHVRPFDAKPEGSNQVKYSVNRPYDVSSKKPVEFHQHLVAQVLPTTEDSDDDAEEEPAEEQKKPEVVFVVSSTPQGVQTSKPPASTESQSAASEKPDEEPSREQTNRPPSVAFPEVDNARPRPQQNYGNTQEVYHATIIDEKPLRPPASTYLQRPLIYNHPTQPSKEKPHGQIASGPVEPDDNVVINKVSYRPQPGLVSSYQPQQGHLHPQQQQGHPHQQQGHLQLQGHPQQHGQPQQQGHSQQQGLKPQSNFQQQYPIHPQAQQHPPVYHHHQVSPQPFGQPNPQNVGQDEKRPVVWPPKGKPSLDNQKIPPFTFFPRPDQPKPATGVGSVEAVRPPPRLTNKPASAAISSVSGDSQSYSLQTSFSIGVPSGPVEDGKVTAGTVSAVSLPHQPQGSPQPHQPLGPPQPQVSHQPHHPQGPPPPHQVRLPQQGGLPPLGQPASANTIKYPPSPWEGNLNKPYKEPLKRKPLPNILPQFRPNAKVGTVEPTGPHSMGMNYLREPVDRLQPPPLPPRPLHRSDDSHQHHQAHQHLNQPHHGHQQQIFAPVRPVAAYLRAETPVPPSQPPMLPPQPVHRRNGVGTKVSTLQMIQSPPPVTRKNEEPVMIVYPSNNVDSSSLKGDSWRRPTPDFSADDEFPHDLDDARKDTPILKGKPPTAKPHLKVEFPYPMEKPLPDGEIKEYQAYTPTSPASEKAPSSVDGLVSHRIQDYHPAMSPTSSSAVSSTSSAAPPKRVVPPEAEFGWSVIGTRSDEDITTPVSSSSVASTSGPMAPPQLTGGFRPIPAPSLD